AVAVAADELPWGLKQDELPVRHRANRAGAWWGGGARLRGIQPDPLAGALHLQRQLVLHPIEEELMATVDGLGLPGVARVARFGSAASALAPPTQPALAGELVQGAGHPARGTRADGQVAAAPVLAGQAYPAGVLE